MKLLVIGQGAREHAIARKLAESSRVEEVFVMPGNPGMGLYGFDSKKIKPTPCALDSREGFQELIALAKKILPRFIVVGPDNPLAEGIVNSLKEHGFRVLGPTREAALLEASKSFSKEVAREAGVATPWARRFLDFEAASHFIREECGSHFKNGGIVIKADGLAFGKGVFVCDDLQEADKALREILLEKEFGEMPALVEERLFGVELSAFALCLNGGHLLLGTATDYKRAYDGNRGPNTGGMGTISPFPCQEIGFTEEKLNTVLDEIVSNTLKVMKERGTPFEGFLFLGLMLKDKQEDRDWDLALLKEHLNLLEYNVRLGDPEAQSLLPRLECDFADVLDRLLLGLAPREAQISTSSQCAATVVLASEGYPGEITRGQRIKGLFDLQLEDGEFLNFAGVSLEPGTKAQLLNHSGRVLSATALASTQEEAIEKAYELLKKISFKGAWHRHDIGAPWFAGL